MPRYMFDVEDHAVDIDDTGCELDDAHAARVQAIMYLDSLLRDEPALVRNGSEFRLRVRNDRGDDVLTLCVRAVAGPGA